MSTSRVQSAFSSLLSTTRRTQLQRIVIWGVAIVLVFTGGVFSSDYRTVANAANVVRQLCSSMILGLGQAIVIIGGGIDLSNGMVVKLGSLLAAGIVNGKDSMVLPAVVIVLLVGLAVGLINGLIITRLKVAPFIATLATASVLRGLSLAYTTTSVGRGSSFTRHFYFGSFLGFPLPGVLLLILAVSSVLFMSRTALGRHIYAVGGNEQVANLAGIHVRRVRLVCYALCGMLAALAGLVVFARMGVGDPVIGEGLELDSITGSILGGISFFGGQGSLIGAIGGIFTLTLINNLLNLLGASGWHQIVIKGAIIVIAVAIYKQRNQ